MSDETTNDTPPEEDTKPPDDLLVIEVRRQIRPIHLKFEDGTELKGTLREMMGTKKDDWLNFCQKRIKVVDGKASGMNDFKGMEAELISQCFYDEDGKLVPKAKIEPWPATVKSKIFKACQKLNALDDESENQVKNS
jgi:hypothetical protein